MQSQVVILSGGREAELLQIRSEVLKISGFTVVSTYSPEELIEKFRKGDFDLVLLCHSFSFDEQAVIEHAVHEQSPSTPVVVMTINEKNHPFADVLVASDPESLVSAVMTATNRRFFYQPRGQAS